MGAEFNIPSCFNAINNDILPWLQSYKLLHTASNMNISTNQVILEYQDQESDGFWEIFHKG